MREKETGGWQCSFLFLLYTNYVACSWLGYLLVLIRFMYKLYAFESVMRFYGKICNILALGVSGSRNKH
jgi:hypothetical protein